jgi:hypothetical protein
MKPDSAKKNHPALAMLFPTKRTQKRRGALALLDRHRPSGDRFNGGSSKMAKVQGPTVALAGDRYAD